MTYTKDSLKKWSGGGYGGSRTKLEVPTIKFNGNTGKLSKFASGDYHNPQDLPESIEMTILRPRRRYTSFEKTSDGPVQLFTNEHNAWKDHITVFEARQGKKIKAVGTGVIENLMHEFPTLQINSVLYVLYDGSIHKFNVRGKSRRALVDYTKKLSQDGKELFEYKVKITPMKEQGPGGNTYYFLSFESGEESNLDEIGPHMEKLGETFDKIDAEYAEYNSRSSSSTPESSEPVNTSASTPSDELKVEDIPF